MAFSFESEELALLAAIHASPREDTFRLVWADLLEEHDAPEHAELVRLQCQRPYVSIMTHNWRQPRRSADYPFPWEDATAETRLARMIELFPVVHHSPRYEQQRQLRYFEQHSRGLPVIQVGSHEDSSGFEPPKDDLLDEIGPLARIDLRVRIGFSTHWLDRKVMRRVDKLHILPGTAPSDEEDWRGHREQFWMEMLHVLTDHPLLDSLQYLRLCGCESDHAMRLAQRVLAPHVHVEYGY